MYILEKIIFAIILLDISTGQDFKESYSSF